ncbi:MAG: multiprotein bridging factor aMBF1 [archaeon]
MCDMCSSKDAVFKVDIEGSKLNVCEKCSRFGRVISRIQAVQPPMSKKEKEKAALEIAPKKTTESVQIIKPDYARLIKGAREKLEMKQEDFAKMLNVKESFMHKIESGHLKPDLELARKLEKALKIVLVEQVEVEVGGGEAKKKGEGLTIGDLIRLK